MTTPNPNEAFPWEPDRSLCFLKNVVTGPNIEIGDFTFYHDAEGAGDFERRNVLYHYPINGDRLRIGKFCSIATGVRFLFNGANHALASLATFPFPIFWGWDATAAMTDAWDNRGDILVGNDVWFGYEAVILAGVTIGDGAIIGTRALVTRDVQPYTIVGGVPAKPIRRRFDAPTIEALERLRWWDWALDDIGSAIAAIRSGDVRALAAMAARRNR